MRDSTQLRPESPSSGSFCNERLVAALDLKCVSSSELYLYSGSHGLLAI